ncbi:RNA repair domain-containing protein [Methylotuvimicrobium sp. KM2]
MRFPKGDHFTFELIDQDGELHSVPYHRVKAIFRNGDLIWHREH